MGSGSREDTPGFAWRHHGGQQRGGSFWPGRRSFWQHELAWAGSRARQFQELGDKPKLVSREQSTKGFVCLSEMVTSSPESEGSYGRLLIWRMIASDLMAMWMLVSRGMALDWGFLIQPLGLQESKLPILGKNAWDLRTWIRKKNYIVFVVNV